VKVPPVSTAIHSGFFELRECDVDMIGTCDDAMMLYGTKDNSLGVRRLRHFQRRYRCLPMSKASRECDG
jgi:hypothetical protein